MSDEASSVRKVIVVGAGIIGASIAWHLSRQGAAVTVIAEKVGGEATPNSFAWINASWGNPEFYYRLRMRSIQEWKRVSEELPGLPLTWSGGLCWDLPEGRLEAYALEHSAWGYDIRPVDRHQSAAIEPNLADVPEYALHARDEGAVEPVAAAKMMLADAFRLGATLLEGVKVVGLAMEGNRIAGVETTDGQLLADHVVLAAGAGTVALAASIGIDIPIEAPPGLIVHSKPHRPLLNGLVIGPRVHMRQTDEGRIIAGSDFGGSVPGENPQVAADALFADMTAMLKDGSELELEKYTIGYRPTPVDGFPIVGSVEGSPGLYIAVLHSGVTLAPLIGQLAANEIIGGKPDQSLEPLRLSRFQSAANLVKKPDR